MGKRKSRGFGWTRDPDDPELRQPVERPNRAALKRHLDALEAVVLSIVALPPSERRALPLQPEILDELEVLARCPPTPARKRQLHYVKRLMGQLPLEPLQAALAGETPRSDRLRQVELWRDRLLEEGDVALAELIDAHPSADRQHLRALIRRASTGARAQRQLFDALKALLLSGDEQGR